MNNAQATIQMLAFAVAVPTVILAFAVYAIYAMNKMRGHR